MWVIMRICHALVLINALCLKFVNVCYWVPIWANSYSFILILVLRKIIFMQIVCFWFYEFSILCHLFVLLFSLLLIICKEIFDNKRFCRHVNKIHFNMTLYVITLIIYIFSVRDFDNVCLGLILMIHYLRALYFIWSWWYYFLFVSFNCRYKDLLFGNFYIWFHVDNYIWWNGIFSLWWQKILARISWSSTSWS